MIGSSETATSAGATAVPTGESPDVVPGLYRHYKNMMYRVIGTARHSETLEKLVVYEALYENKLGKLWVRPAAMFSETVSVSGQTVPRFQRIIE